MHVRESMYGNVSRPNQVKRDCVKSMTPPAEMRSRQYAVAALMHNVSVILSRFYSHGTDIDVESFLRMK